MVCSKDPRSSYEPIRLHFEKLTITQQHRYHILGKLINTPPRSKLVDSLIGG